MISWREVTLIAVTSVLLIYSFPWLPFRSRSPNCSASQFTKLREGWHHPGAHHSLASGTHKPDTLGHDDWHIHDYLGGNGPWISRADAVNNDIRPPAGCVVDQVHMLSRHNERFPTMKAGLRLLDLLKRLYHSDVTLIGDLDFANEWKFFTSEPEKDFDQLTRSGPYAGTLGAFTTGVKLRTRYEHLLRQHFEQNQTLYLWAGDSERVIETAQHFATGLLGLDWKDRATLHVIPEDFTTGGDTLTPGKACPSYQQDLEQGREGGYTALAKLTDATFVATAKRLQRFVKTRKSHKFELSTVDVYAMQELCGFEVMTRGTSPWCDIFTKEEWERFAYARDILHYYRAGPGSKYSHAMGHIYLNATANLMLQGPDAGPLFFSFVHDGDIVPVLSALHVMDDDAPLPITKVKDDRKWKTSRITPMGGRIIFERLFCPRRSANGGEDTFVRININDGVVSIPECDVGAGLCPLQDFVSRLSKYQEQAGDFREVCGLSDGMPSKISFLHQ